MNEAFCEKHIQDCVLDDGSVHPIVRKECQRTFSIAEEIRLAYLALGSGANMKGSLCQDADENCASWIQEGRCISNAGMYSLLRYYSYHTEL
jgi:hypothetical protein